MYTTEEKKISQIIGQWKQYLQLKLGFYIHSNNFKAFFYLKGLIELQARLMILCVKEDQASKFNIY